MSVVGAGVENVSYCAFARAADALRHLNVWR